MTAPDLEKRLRQALVASGRASSDYDLNQDIILPEGRSLSPASVLIGVRAETEKVVLTKRSPRLKHHPGQIAFPGGRQDATDHDPTAAALREAQEEIGLSPHSVRVLGSLPTHETVTGYCVTPILALIDGPFIPVPEAGEVSEVFEVPLSFLLNPSNFDVQSRIWQGKDRHYYTVPFGPYYIWGATARILRALADRMSA